MRHRRADIHPVRVQTGYIGDILHVDQCVVENRIAMRADIDHVGDAAEHARDLFGRAEQILLLARGGAGRPDQTVMHFGGVEAGAFDALQNADDGDGKQGDSDRGQQCEAQRPAAFSRRILFVCGGLRRVRPGARADPVAP